MQYVYIYHFYRSALMRSVRLLALFFLSVLIFNGLNNGALPKWPLFFLSYFMMFEIFFTYKISRYAPRVPLDKNSGNDMFVSCSRDALNILLVRDKTSSIIIELFRLPQARFLLEKANIAQQEVQLLEISKDDLLKHALTLAKTAKGTLITTMDLLAAYLLITESQTKLLFNKQLKEEEFTDILFWARFVHKKEETPGKKRVHVYGSGIGEVITTGWTPETKKYTNDFSYAAYRQDPQITGREKEFSLLLEGLSRRENNNVLLVGNAGSGRENLVALLAKASYDNTIHTGLHHVRVLELMIGPLIAGAANRAELESRLQAIIDEVSHSGNVVLYIPEFQNITGSSSYNVDLSGALFPYLKEGKISIVASVNMGSYKTYMERSPLMEAFLLVKLAEPEKRTAMTMLLQRAQVIEEKYQVILTFKAIEAAVEYADRYFQDAALPGSAVSVLEDVAHRLGSGKTRRPVLAEDVVSLIEEKTHIAVAAPKAEEKNLLLHLEDKLHERVIDQVDAIGAISEAMRRLRAGMVSMKRPISFLFLGPTGVGKTETAKALAELYFGGEEKMLRLDMSEYSDAEGLKRLLGAPPGEGEERGELTDKIADNPFSLVLLDEFEKAYPKILDLFLQVLEDGRLTDNKGKTVSFVNSIVIATSNAGAEFIREEIQKGSAIDKDFSHRLLDHLQTTHLFRPELINRFDDVVIFKPLGEPEMIQITKIMLKDFAKRLLEQDVTFTYDDSLVAKAVKEGFDQQFGARPLRRYIQDNIEDALAQRKLRDEIKRGSRVNMSVDANGVIQVNVQ